MIITLAEESKVVNVTSSCIAREYPNGDKDIWGAVITVKGRYPEQGVTVNHKCKELVYFIEGKGKVVINGKEFAVKKGDQVVIDPEEKFYWEGDLKMFMPCTPAWYPAQHEAKK